MEESRKASKKKLIFSALMLLLSFTVFLALTLGWLFAERRNVDTVDLFYAGANYDFYFSTDKDGDGRPDVDGGGDVVYELKNDGTLIFKNYYPGVSTKFKMIVNPPKETKTLSVVFLNLSEPVFPDDVDYAKAFYIEYDDPVTSLHKNISLYDLMIEKGTLAQRDIIIFEKAIGNDEEFIFDYTMYMHSGAGNIFQPENAAGEFIIEKVIFSLSYT